MESTIEKEKRSQIFENHIRKKIDFWKKSMPNDSIKISENTIEFTNAKRVKSILQILCIVFSIILIANIVLIFYYYFSVILIITAICLILMLYFFILKPLLHKTIIHINTGKVESIILNRIIKSDNLDNLVDIDSKISHTSRALKGIFSKLIFKKNSSIYIGYTLENTECIFIGNIFLPIRDYNKKK